MFKDIVVNLNVRSGCNYAGDYAVSVADTLQAHITGIAFAFIPNIPGASMGYLPIETIETQQRENEDAAERAADYFDSATASVGIAAEPRVIRTSFDDAADNFSRMARRFDLAIIGQGQSETSGIEAAIVESTLFESGRPIIIVPYIQKTPLKLHRVMVCWDGSRAATRAIADAMPLLERADNIEVVTVTNERSKRKDTEGIDMGLHLARHGVKVEVRRITRGDADVVDALLSHAADSGTDLMVMGGYGHSRLREFVLGGVTRSILRTMTVPTLMSH